MLQLKILLSYEMLFDHLQRSEIFSALQKKLKCFHLATPSSCRSTIGSPRTSRLSMAFHRRPSWDRWFLTYVYQIYMRSLHHRWNASSMRTTPYCTVILVSRDSRVDYLSPIILGWLFPWLLVGSLSDNFQQDFHDLASGSHSVPGTTVSTSSNSNHI